MTTTANPNSIFNIHWEAYNESTSSWSTLKNHTVDFGPAKDYIYIFSSTAEKIRVSFSSPNASIYPLNAKIHQVLVSEELTKWWSNGDQVNGSPSMLNDNGRLKLQTDKIWSGAVSYPIVVANKGKLHTLRFDAEVVQLNGAQVFIGVDESNDGISWNPIGNEVFRNAPIANQEYEVNFTPTKNYIRIYTSTWTATANISAPTEVYYDNFSINDGTTQPVTGGGLPNKVAFKYRIHDVTIGRFLSVDPLAVEYPWNSPYSFAENDVIRSIDLEGAEKVALSGEGNGSNYTQSDMNAFYTRAVRMEKLGYSVYKVSTGSDIIDALISETASKGYVSRIVNFSHGGYNGLFLNEDEGLYTSGISYGGFAERSISDIKSAVESGEINLSSNTVWVMGSCNACYNGGTSSDFAYDATSQLGITTIAATGYVEPEIVDGKATGRMTTTGTFKKISKVYDITFNINGESKTHTFKSRSQAEAFNKGFNGDGAFDSKINERVETQDLGNTIDPADY